MDRVNLEKRKGCLPSGGNSRSVAESGGNGAKKFPAGGSLASSSSQPAPRGSCPASTAEPGTVGNLPPLCVMPVAPCLLLGSGHSQSGQDP